MNAPSIYVPTTGGENLFHRREKNLERPGVTPLRQESETHKSAAENFSRGKNTLESSAQPAVAIGPLSEPKVSKIALAGVQPASACKAHHDETLAIVILKIIGFDRTSTAC
jgi:hypothetical protein